MQSLALHDSVDLCLDLRSDSEGRYHDSSFLWREAIKDMGAQLLLSWLQSDEVTWVGPSQRPCTGALRGTGQSGRGRVGHDVYTAVVDAACHSNSKRGWLPKGALLAFQLPRQSLLRGNRSRVS